MTLGWEQVRAWRLARQHLLERVERDRLLEVVGDLAGVHAQLQSSATLALAARVRTMTTGALEDALWVRRSLVKTWAMRGTLHLLPAGELPTWIAGLGIRRHYLSGAWLAAHGITREELRAVIAAVPAALDGRCLTRERLVEEIIAVTGMQRLGGRLRNGWGDLLKPSAYLGDLCFGRSVGRNVTFVRCDQWLGGWSEVDPDQALRQVLCRYLAAYGPASHEDLARWLGVKPAVGRRLLERLAAEGLAARVDVEGYRAWAPAEAGSWPSLPDPPVVRLLPSFDPYVVAAFKHCDRLVPGPFKHLVYRQAGWVSPVVLVNGEIQGVWRRQRRAGRVELRVEPFIELAPAARALVHVEAEALAALWGDRVEVSYAEP